MSGIQSKICVVGAGVVGLSTALCLQKEFPSALIHIFTDKINEDTLSAGAGGMFRPEISVHHDRDRVKRWCFDSLKHYLNLIKSEDSSKAGMQLVSGYHLSSTSSSMENDLLQELLLEYRQLTKKEMELFPPHFKTGVLYTTVVTDCRYYLPWMKNKFEENGGRIIFKFISDFSEIPDDFDIIVNCSGLGAKSLCDDNMLIPIRGQTIKVQAPWIKHFYYGDSSYVIPGLDYVTLGGIKDFNCSIMDVNPLQSKQIWEKCTELVPSLKKAKVVWEWVGLRPYRPSVRVDTCFVKCKDRFKLIVNNYGHGAHGVTLSWGTALEAAQLAHQALQQKEFMVSKL